MRRLHYGWIILAFGVLATLSALGLARFGYTMILPSMQKGLQLTSTEAGGLATGNFIGYLCMALGGGFLASHFSPRRVIVLSLVFIALTLLLTGFSQGIASAALCRTLTGIASGGANVPMMGLLAAWFAPSRRGFAAGLAVSGSSLGLVLTGWLIPPILEAAPTEGWRYAWFALSGIAFAIAGLGLFVLRNRPADLSLRPVGAHGEAPSLNPLRGESSSWHSVYRSRVVWHLSLIYTAFGFSYIIYVTFFAKYLESELNYTREAAGYLWSVVGWNAMICGILWGWISDWLGRRFALVLVSLGHVAAYLLFALHPSEGGLLISAVLFGITAWSIPAIMASACGDQMGVRLAPAALGLVTLFMGIGQALGPLVAGALEDGFGSFVPAFVLAAAGAGICAFSSALLNHHPLREDLSA